MKQKIFFAIFVLMGILTCPVLALAKNDYYVDAGADSKGDGSKDKPFKKISDAIDKGGKEIIVDKGTYKENITLDDGVKIKGDGSDTVIEGKIVMKDNSSIQSLKVENGGVFVGKGDSAQIESVTIKGAGIGIETEGNGTVKISNSTISGNGKGMYIQRDKDVEIRSSIVSHNNEEGIDIRQNVDGIISGNKIQNNGEGGIEVIAGGSELKINANTIQSNKSSGIAVQYYKIANRTGALRVYDNVIASNGQYGVTCKNPSGGSPGGSYWTESVDMGANKMLSNKSGEFAPFCKFSEDVVSVATKTEAELEQERLAQEKLEEEERIKEEEEQKKLEELEEVERLKLEEERRMEEERIQKEEEQIRMQNEENKNEIENVYSEFLEKSEKDRLLKEEVENRSKILTFFIGSDHKKLDALAEDVLTYDEKVAKIDDLKSQSNNEEIKMAAEEKVKTIEEKEENFKQFIVSEINKFSLLGWFFDLFKKQP